MHTADAKPRPSLIHPCRLFGPKRKMTSAIARWHSSARPPSDALELAYADRLEAEMQELAIQLHKVSGESQGGDERCLETHTCREGHSHGEQVVGTDTQHQQREAARAAIGH